MAAVNLSKVSMTELQGKRDTYVASPAAVEREDFVLESMVDSLRYGSRAFEG